MNNNVWILSLAIVAGQLIKFPVGGGGISLLDSLVIILCGIGLVRLKFNLRKPPLFITAAMIFALVGIISLIFTPLHLQSSEYLISFLYIARFTFYILFAQLTFSGAFANFQKQISRALIYSGVGLAVLGLLQFILLPDLSSQAKWGWDPHYFRTASTFLDPNFAGAYFVLTLIVFMSSPFKSRFLRLFGMAVVYLALLTTFSRSSYLMFLVSGLSLSFFQKSKKLIIKVLVFFIILLLGFQLYGNLISRPRNIDREQSASFRLNTWQQGLKLFQTYPILGVGFNSYKYALKEFNVGDEQFLNSHGATSNDSSLLFVAATTGLLGLFAYLLFLFSLIKTGLRSNITLVAATLGLLVHSIFANSLFYPPILLWLMAICVSPKK